jgi:hypothetical protein
MTEYPGPVAREVDEAIREARSHLSTRDAGAVALARRYAHLIDEAALAANYGEPLRVLGMAVHTKDERQALQRITDALAAHSVASDLGPKLLAALTALGLTPAARQAKGGDSGGAGPGTGKLGDLRAAAQRRAERQRTG